MHIHINNEIIFKGKKQAGEAEKKKKKKEAITLLHDTNIARKKINLHIKKIF